MRIAFALFVCLAMFGCGDTKTSPVLRKQLMDKVQIRDRLGVMRYYLVAADGAGIEVEPIDYARACIGGDWSAPSHKWRQ
jgi:hypothetical protein